MKKIILSAAVAAMAFSTAALADDKGIDVVTSGQAVVYYQTNITDATGQPDLFDQSASSANVGLQLNLNADLKNNFSFGTQLTYLGTAGLEKNLVSGVRQSVGSPTGMTNAGDEIAITKIYIAKKIGNTTAKIGRQELPKSLSPFAYSEGWNVFKNTFEAILLVNTDIPNTTVVGAYVGQSNKHANLGTFTDLTPGAQGVAAPAGNVAVDGAAYMLTVQNKSIPMTTVTVSYYDVSNVRADSNASVGVRDISFEGANALWADVAVAGKDLPAGLKIGLQGGTITTENSGLADTTAMGVKVFASPVKGLTVGAAYTSVDGDDNKAQVAVKNFGTGVKSPLYTQMVANQNAISLDADTIQLKAVYGMGDMGTIIAQGTQTTAGKSNLVGSEVDFTDLELLYKLKAGGVNYLLAYVNTNTDPATGNGVNTDIIRFWARYNF